MSRSVRRNRGDPAAPESLESRLAATVREAVSTAVTAALADHHCACNLDSQAHHHFHEGATSSLAASQAAVEALAWARRTSNDLDHLRRVGLRTLIVIALGALISALAVGIRSSLN